MGVNKVLRFAMTCVAAIVVLSGCSSETVLGSTNDEPRGSAGTTEPEVPDSTTMPQVPPGYDELENWSSGETSPELEAAAAAMGLFGMTWPRQDFLDDGYTGVAPLEESCIIAFSVLGADQPDRMSAVIFSRFDLSMQVVMPNASLDELAAFADSYRPDCSGMNA